jgi:hypothetical protein
VKPESEKTSHDPQSPASKQEDRRLAWERPALRRLGADPAISGGTADYYVYTS